MQNRAHVSNFGSTHRVDNHNSMLLHAENNIIGSFSCTRENSLALVHTDPQAQPDTNLQTFPVPDAVDGLLPVTNRSNGSSSRLPAPGADNTAPPVFELPSSFNRDFRVTKDLGAGYFGETALVEVIAADAGGKAHNLHFRLGQSVVIKRVTPKVNRKPHIFQSEWRAMSAVRGHENVVQAFGARDPEEDAIASSGYIFMEHCDLGDVDQLLKRYHNFAQSSKHRVEGVASRGAPPEGFAYEMTKSIVDGIAWLHYGVRDWRDRMLPANWQTIMHNDIKPDNIFMTSRQQGDPCIYPIFKIADFGGATDMSDIAFVGSLMTSSPERVTTLFSTASMPQDDIFSIGATMYHVAHGYQPFSEKEFVHAVSTSCGICGGIPATQPRQCRQMDVQHHNMLPMNSASAWSGCGVYSVPNYNRRRPMARSALPYARWWHDLVDDCLEVEGRDRPDAIELAESLFMARRGHGERTGGIHEVLWETPWLSPEERQIALQENASECLIV
ncbi:hypothetical protein ABW21_db0207102 [Orbilia brochopaga]|nr:hypothetical protein ABW21_db0207102 [Drechslerella brochopaga]